MPLGGIVFLVIFISLFGFALIRIARWAGGGLRSGQGTQFDPYECGIPSLEREDTKISVKFYLTAILFILFDIEIIFMYPWAVTFKEFISAGEGTPVAIAMLIFVLIFIYGLFWEIKSKALEWD